MYVKVRVYPGMRQDVIKKVDDDSYEIITKAPAERNLANTRVREMVAEEYSVAVAAVRIVSGHHNSSKILTVIKSANQ